MSRQLALDLPLSPRFGREDFLVGSANARAFALVESWPGWPDRLMRLGGPPGSGKSHLAAIWAERSGAATLAVSAVTDAEVPTLSRLPALVLEDYDSGGIDEHALFHLVNLGRERGVSILITGARPVEACGFRTPDLLSRLRLAPSTALEPPDDDLLRAVLVKLFGDRQIAVDTSVVDFVATRIERSLAAAARIVRALDQEALSRGRRVTRPMAATVLSQAEDEAGEPDDVHSAVTSGT